MNRRERRARGERGGDRRAAARLRERLLDLAYDARSYLRQSSEPAVRISAALLLATSLAACADMDLPGALTEPPLAEVQPLAQEVRSGLPQQPGRYPVHKDSVWRDQQGVYHFAWRATSGPENVRNEASVSLLRLQEAGENVLEVPAQGDPILHLQKDTPVTLASAAGGALEPAPQPDGSRTIVTGPLWYPLFAGMSRPAYYDLPARTTISRDRVEGGIVSDAPKPRTDRVISSPGVTSGRAGGTGAGSAVSQKAGVSGGKSGTAVSAPKSSGFSLGSSGGAASKVSGSS